MYTPPEQEIKWLLKEKYQGVESPEFFADVERLKKEEPLAYIIGWIDFLGTKIDVSLHPMIPRPETEFWLERAIKELEVRTKPLKILDVFSGSGCIGIAVAKHIPESTVDFSEFDPVLAQQIAMNCKLNGIEKSRTRIFTGDAFEKITDTYDAIFANPPYIDPKGKEEMDWSVIGFEPHLAFFSDEAGMKHAHEIIDTGAKYLNDGGVYYIEHDAHQRPGLIAMLEDTPWKYEFWNDQYGQIRFLILRK